MDPNKELLKLLEELNRQLQLLNQVLGAFYEEAYSKSPWTQQNNIELTLNMEDVES